MINNERRKLLKKPAKTTEKPPYIKLMEEKTGKKFFD
jgi:hypothetical protein